MVRSSFVDALYLRVHPSGLRNDLAMTLLTPLKVGQASGDLLTSVTLFSLLSLARQNFPRAVQPILLVTSLTDVYTPR